MNHEQPSLTPEQRANLAKLADYLVTVPQSAFDMADYQQKTDCGTVACAVGHGPEAGVQKRDCESWNQYSDRVFAPQFESWGWCFSDHWSVADNTPQGAAARIRYMLEHGVPSNWRDQMLGNAPLSYINKGH